MSVYVHNITQKVKLGPADIANCLDISATISYVYGQ